MGRTAIHVPFILEDSARCEIPVSAAIIPNS
jgi:hypothetical protein